MNAAIDAILGCTFGQSRAIRRSTTDHLAPLDIDRRVAGMIRRMCAPFHSLLRRGLRVAWEFFRHFAESAWAFLHGLGTDKLRDLVLRQLQDFACQMAVGEPKFIQKS